MRYLLAVMTCAALLVGCASDQQTTIDPTTAGSMGASGSGAVSLPSGDAAVTNTPAPIPERSTP